MPGFAGQGFGAYGSKEENALWRIGSKQEVCILNCTVVPHQHRNRCLIVHAKKKKNARLAASRWGPAPPPRLSLKAITITVPQ